MRPCSERLQQQHQGLIGSDSHRRLYPTLFGESPATLGEQARRGDQQQPEPQEKRGPKQGGYSFRFPSKPRPALEKGTLGEPGGNPTQRKFVIRPGQGVIRLIPRRHSRSKWQEKERDKAIGKTTPFPSSFLPFWVEDWRVLPPQTPSQH